MQTLTSPFEQLEQPVSLQLETTAVEPEEGILLRTIVPSLASEEVQSNDIRPLTPEITYPYPLYKSEEYYSRRLAMKPNQVGLYVFYILDDPFYTDLIALYKQGLIGN